MIESLLSKNMPEIYRTKHTKTFACFIGPFRITIYECHQPFAPFYAVCGIGTTEDNHSLGYIETEIESEYTEFIAETLFNHFLREP